MLSTKSKRRTSLISMLSFQSCRLFYAQRLTCRHCPHSDGWEFIAIGPAYSFSLLLQLYGIASSALVVVILMQTINDEWAPVHWRWRKRTTSSARERERRPVTETAKSAAGLLSMCPSLFCLYFYFIHLVVWIFFFSKSGFLINSFFLLSFLFSQPLGLLIENEAIIVILCWRFIFDGDLGDVGGFAIFSLSGWLERGSCFVMINVTSLSIAEQEAW